jgi:hypothetical protein
MCVSFTCDDCMAREESSIPTNTITLHLYLLLAFNLLGSLTEDDDDDDDDDDLNAMKTRKEKGML